MKIGYTSGVFDLFHVGHLALLEKASRDCDFLIVAVCSDKLAFDLKGRKPIIPFEDRFRIISSLKCVNRVICKAVDDEFLMAKSVQANVVFKGDDWKATQKWLVLEKKFKAEGIKVKFFPYTQKVSSSSIRKELGL